MDEKVFYACFVVLLRMSKCLIILNQFRAVSINNEGHRLRTDREQSCRTNSA